MRGRRRPGPILGVLLAAGLAAALPVPLPAASGDESRVVAREAELQALRSRIRQTQQELDQARDHYGKLQRELRDAEREVSRLHRAQAEIDHKAEAGRERLDGLHVQRRDLQLDLDDQRHELERLLRAVYAFGRQERIKLLLNQGNPATVSRMFTYYDHLQRARAERIQALRANLTQLAAVEEAIREENTELERLRDDYRRQGDALKLGQAERKRVLESLDREIASKGSELERLQGDEQRLGRLLESLREALARLPAAPEPEEAKPRRPSRPFHRSKGALPWPVGGKLSHRYGTSRGVGGLTWQGIVIGAPEGREVRAVSRGRVVFADWLRGYGMLVILDHGKDYLSLYGYNQALYTEVGEWVEEGQRIASVGASGGQRASGLYFEIRRKGRPQNPTAWLAKDRKVARR